MNVPEGADLLDQEAAGQPKTSAAWSPYKSKTVSWFSTRRPTIP
jgi:hypothetical protein